MYNTYVCFGKTMQSVGQTAEGTAVTLVIILNSLDLQKYCMRHSMCTLWIPMFNQDNFPPGEYLTQKCTYSLRLYEY